MKGVFDFKGRDGWHNLKLIDIFVQKPSKHISLIVINYNKISFMKVERIGGST
jgi:hypothetical protein